MVAVFGALAAFAGIEHGIGEVRQGFVAPASLAFQSWPDTQAFEILSGEPAMTLIPNLAVSGIATLIVSIVIGILALRFVDRTHGGRALLAFSLLLLLVGGGFGPPLIGVIAGLAAIRAQRPEQPPPGPVLRALAPRWRAFLFVGVAGYVGLVPGVPLLGHIANVQSEALVIVLIVLAFSGLILALVAAGAHDRLVPRGSDVRSAGAWRQGQQPTTGQEGRTR